jgi:hypothetical protein
MRVIHTGRKRDAKKNSNVCQTDVISLADMEDNDVVAILRVGRHSFCYLLEGLARWFMEGTLKDTLPSLPDTRTPVPAHIYRRILSDAHIKVPGFARTFNTQTRDLSPEKRKFVLRGIAPATRATRSGSDDMFTVEELLQFMGDSSPPRQRRARSPRRSRSRSPRRARSRSPGRNDDDLEAMLGSMSDLELADLMQGL